MKIEERNGRLTAVDFDEIDAYKIACAVEKEGIWFYQKLKDKIDKPRAKEVLSFLIEEERKHLRLFEEQLFKVRAGKEDDFEDDSLLSSMDFGIFKPYKDVEELENVLTDINRALKLAIIIEDKSIKFYELCRDNVSQEVARQELENIIEEEKEHKALLESILKK